MITLPTNPLPAVHDLTANNILITGDYGMGKSGLLASTGYLLADPEDKLRSYPDLLRVTLTDWRDHKDFVKEVAKKKPDVPGIGLDSLNVSYDQCLAWVMSNVTFQKERLTHPSENPQIAYPRITHEFITWLREVTYLGYHVVATCHVNIAEITVKGGGKYNRWVPAFTGSSPTSTYASILKVFSIVGFMTMEGVEKPSTKLDARTKTMVVDLRSDAARLQPETTDTRVIHFDQSPNWLSNNKQGGFPDKVVLTNDYRQDWDILKAAWGSEGHTLAEEEVKTEGLAAPKGVVTK